MTSIGKTLPSGLRRRRSRATKPLNKSLSRPLEAPMRHMIWSSQRRVPFPGTTQPTAQSQAPQQSPKKKKRKNLQAVLLSPPLLKRRQGRIAPSRHPHPFETRAPKLQDFGRLHARGNKKEIKPLSTGPTNFGPKDDCISTAPPKVKAEVTVDLQYLVESESKFRALKQLLRLNVMKTMTGASAFTIGWAVAMFTEAWTKGAPE
ncbi:hypothetical protein Tco_0215523 [Tanacetum coccineum]